MGATGARGRASGRGEARTGSVKANVKANIKANIKTATNVKVESIPAAALALSGELAIEFEGESAPHRVAPGGFFFGARGRRHAFRNVGDKPARVLILCASSCGLDQMFGELEAATGAGMSEFGKLAAITAKYGVTIEPPAA